MKMAPVGLRRVSMLCFRPMRFLDFMLLIFFLFQGVNNAVIQSENPNADTKQVTGAINQLLVSGKIDVFK